jgi:hypothetical protein
MTASSSSSGCGYVGNSAELSIISTPFGRTPGDIFADHLMVTFSLDSNMTESMDSKSGRG